MTKEELEKALIKAWQMGRNYQSLSDSDYTTHWKMADVVREQFDQLVEEAVGKVQEQAEQECGYDETTGNCTKENCCRAQPEQEPVAWKTDDVELYVREDKFGFYNIPLYTHPPQRKPLTDEEIWVLTSEYNDYDQHGEYFEAIFIGKPTSKQIQKHCHVTEQGAVHILNGGGRVKYEDQWYNLRKEKAAHGIEGEV